MQIIVKWKTFDNRQYSYRMGNQRRVRAILNAPSLARTRHNTGTCTNFFSHYQHMHTLKCTRIACLSSTVCSNSLYFLSRTSMYSNSVCPFLKIYSNSVCPWENLLSFSLSFKQLLWMFTVAQTNVPICALLMGIRARTNAHTQNYKK